MTLADQLKQQLDKLKTVPDENETEKVPEGTGTPEGETETKRESSAKATRLTLAAQIAFHTRTRPDGRSTAARPGSENDSDTDEEVSCDDSSATD